VITTDHGKANGKLLSLAAAGRVHPLYNLQSRARTHVVLVIGLYEYEEEEEEYFIDQLRTHKGHSNYNDWYELLGNPTT
jgi:hypothetical protein